MRCPGCKAESREGARFCEDCGGALPQACPHCDEPVTAGKRFCGACGGALAGAPAGAPAAERGEHKPVTALFCDIAGSTALAERLGSEAMLRLLDRFVRICVEEVQRYGGTVDKFLGDGVLALVGVPRAHEDHARRAVLAALALRERLASELAGVLGEGAAPQVRIGVHSGSVVVGTLGDGPQRDRTAVGDTTNVAARLEAIASPGEIIVSGATARLVQGYARLEPLGEVTLRGRRAPVEAFRVLGAGERRSRLDAASALSPFVGRDEELATIRRHLAAALGGAGRVLGIVAEPGMGKSRLVRELRGLAAGATVLEGQCASFGATTPYGPVLDLVRGLVGVSAADPVEEVRRRVAVALARAGVEEPEALALVRALLGDDAAGEQFARLTPEAVKLRTFATLRRLLVGTSRRRPLVLVVEDLHWIDATSEAMLSSLGEELSAAPILVIATYRPEYRPPWAGEPWAEQLVLPPLAAAAGRSVLRAALGRAEVDGDAEASLLERAEGNPFFLEELARAVADDGTAAVPDTVHAVLLARIDRLPPRARDLLRTASVIGRRFGQALLAEVAGGAGLTDDLDRLVASGFLTPAPTGDGDHVFVHALTQDSAYASLLSERRRQLHEAVAHGLERLHADRPADVHGLLGHHYSRAGRHAPAVRHLRTFAEASAARHAHAEAAEALETALAHAAELPEPERRREAVTLTLRLAASLYFRGRFADSGRRLAAVRDDVALLDEAAVSAQYEFAVGLVESHVGTVAETVASARRAIAHAERCGDLGTMGRAHYLLCRESFWLSELQRSLAEGEQAIELLGAAEEQWWRGQCHCFLSLTLIHLGALDEAEAFATRGRAIGAAMGDVRLQSYGTWNLGFVEYSRGHPERAIDLAARALETSPDPLNTAFATGLMGVAMAHAGRPAAGLPHLRRATAALHGFGVRRTAGWFEGYVAELLLASGDATAARAAALRARDTTTATGHRWGLGVAQRALGRIALDAGAGADAERHLSEALATFRSIDARYDAAIVHADLARWAAAHADPQTAAAHLAEAKAGLRRSGAAALLERLTSSGALA